jgi:excinuclease ABC subunit B
VIRPVEDQVQDCINECRKTAEAGYRTLVTTLTKRMAEDLTEFMHEAGCACATCTATSRRWSASS